MCTIQFQGLCYFDRKTDANVSVYLPVAHDHSHHPNEMPPTPARSHYPRLFVRTDEGVNVQTTGGFVQRRWHHSRGTVEGRMLALERRGGACRISVGNQGGPPPDKTGLGSLISFATFDVRGPFAVDQGRVVASMVITGGSFSCKRMTSHDWTVGTTVFRRPAWRIDWSPAGDRTLATVITIDVGGDAHTLTVPPDADPTIIVGNLDEGNAASWPVRPSMKAAECEDATGRTRGQNSTVCYDNDFKWFYPLLPGSYPPQPGQLPVPHNLNVSGAGIYDTPTCFPGGD